MSKIVTEAMNFDQLFAGEVPYIVKVKVAKASYKRGELLECVVSDGAMAATYGKPTAKASINNAYVICAEDVEAEANDVVVAYKEGYFNANKVTLATSTTVADNVDVLNAKNIFLLNTQDNSVTA